MWYRIGIGMNGGTVSYQEKIHGGILLEYVNKPHDGYTYCLTKYGSVFRRKGDDAEWSKFYDVMVHAVGAHVALVRQAPFQEILVDNYDGPAPSSGLRKPVSEPEKETYRTKSGKVLTDGDIEALSKEAEAGYDPAKFKETERSKRRRSRVAKTTDAPKKEKKEKVEEAVKPQRLGARAKKLLEGGLELTRPQQDEVRAKADEISRARVLPSGRQDTLTRVWDIYEASGKEMPEAIRKERDEFMKTGVLKRSGNGKASAPKETRGGKNAASPTPSSETSKQQQDGHASKHDNGGPQNGASKTPANQTSGSSNGETETL